MFDTQAVMKTRRPTITETSNSVRPTTATEILRDSLDVALARADRLVGMVRSFADTMSGPLPPSGRTENASPARDGRVGELHDRAERLSDFLGALEHEVDRLGNI